MRLAITSMFKSVLGVRFAIFGCTKFTALQGDCSQMRTLSVFDLRHVCGGGGGGEDLPKGGW